jgi:hypothetical protein
LACVAGDKEPTLLERVYEAIKPYLTAELTAFPEAAALDPLDPVASYGEDGEGVPGHQRAGGRGRGLPLGFFDGGR